MCLIDGFRSIIYQYRAKNIEIKCSTPVSANSTLSAKNTEATVIYRSIYVDGKRLSSQFEDETNSINRATQSINTVAAIM
ncbi:MAG: hypothetical protein PHE20_03170 [Patescibacteria group bacterium]|nr:hypothetical protein [Patescibacteria group bacterium]